MRDEFTAYVRPSPEAIAQYWQEGDFAVDTNVLLNLYRYSEDARSELLSTLRALDSRLWIPHQVADEYHRLRYQVLLERHTARDSLARLLDEQEADLVSKLEKHERTHTRRAGKGEPELPRMANRAFERLRSQLLKKEDHTRAQLGGADPLDEDPVYSELSNLIAGRIGDPLPTDRLETIPSDAQARYEQQVPPGYGDAGKEGNRQYGDLIIWYQMIDHVSQTHRPLIFVTSDVKDDWFWRIGGRTIGPRPELIREMQDKTSVPFYAYATDRFLEMARAHLGLQSVTDRAISEVRAASPREATTMGRAPAASDMLNPPRQRGSVRATPRPRLRVYHSRPHGGGWCSAYDERIGNIHPYELRVFCDRS